MNLNIREDFRQKLIQMLKIDKKIQNRKISLKKNRISQEKYNQIELELKQIKGTHWKNSMRKLINPDHSLYSVKEFSSRFNLPIITTKKQIFDIETSKIINILSKWLKLTIPKPKQKDYHINWLKPYRYNTFKYNEELIITSPRGIKFKIRLYGKFKGHTFTKKDITPQNIQKVLCIHDANHSVSLFLNQYKNCDIALHNYIPFIFPYSTAYTIYYSQQLNYPLIITERIENVEQMLYKNQVASSAKRWCTKYYKIFPTSWLYKYYKLSDHNGNLTQVLGMTAESPTRFAKWGKIPNILKGKPVISTFSQKNFKRFTQLPIFWWDLEKQLNYINKEGKKFNIPPNPIESAYFSEHGCMFCPYKNEQFFFRLKAEYPTLYKQCHKFRLMGSKKRVDQGGKEWYWFLDSKIM